MTPVIILSDKARCLVSIDVAIAFGEVETRRYTKDLGPWVSTLGQHNRFSFYPLGSVKLHERRYEHLNPISSL